MSLLIPARTAQNVVEASFTFNFNDTMVDAAGVTRDFGSLAGGSAAATAYAFDAIPLPAGATVVGGSVDRSTAFDTAGFDVTIGDATSADRYLASTDLKAVGSQALVPTGFISTGEKVRIGFTTDDACTTGVCTVRVQYTVAGKADIVQIK